MEIVAIPKSVAIHENNRASTLRQAQCIASLSQLYTLAERSRSLFQIKGALYAEAAIANYWLFNLIDNRLEVYSEPYTDAQGKGNYAHRRYVLDSQSVSLNIFPNEDLSLELNKVLPKTFQE
ncbi:MAG: hypothetical protein DCE90_08630 [Pseudanabaena sp.]|nr:MAG: hypothetical protein DCE90_08630 [Pseudanabaena sp.]